MPAAKLLDQLADALCDNDGLSLWHILTALRGPDSEVELEKQATTNVIRYYLTKPYNRARMQGNVGCFLNSDTPELAAFRAAGKFTNTHFFLHAKLAFEAMGLTWYAANTPMYDGEVPIEHL